MDFGPPIFNSSIFILLFSKFFKLKPLGKSLDILSWQLVSSMRRFHLFLNHFDFFRCILYYLWSKHNTIFKFTPREWSSTLSSIHRSIKSFPDAFPFQNTTLCWSSNVCIVISYWPSIQGRKAESYSNVFLHLVKDFSKIET